MAGEWTRGTIPAGKANVAASYWEQVAKNFVMGLPAVRQARLARPRAGAEFDGSDDLLRRYAFQSLNLLDQYGGGVKRRSVLEIGAGDTLASGFALLAAGATRYVNIDRFAGDYASEIAKGWYGGIEAAWAQHYPNRPWPADLKAKDFPERYADRAEVLRVPIESADPQGLFDVVCSFQVGEHVSDIVSFAEASRRFLAPSGIAVHRIDYGPHDVWRRYNDPLVFLRFSDADWHRTGSNRGIPNRFRHHEFIDAFESAGLQVETVNVHKFAEDEMDARHFHPRFRAMPSESLAIRDAVYVLRTR